MDRPVRIAVVGSPDERLTGELRQLPLRPEVRQIGSLVAETEALMRFQPDVLLVRFDDEPDEDIGAVRLLQRLWPALTIAVITTAGDEVKMGPIATRLAARLIVYPDTPGHLAAVLEQMLQGSDRPRPDLFVDLAHGLADEINNPLLFVSGHLQLLRASMQGANDSTSTGQIDAALGGLKRIQVSVDRLRLLSQAAEGPKRREAVDLTQLIADAMAARTQDTTPATISISEGSQIVDGDREQLTLAVEAIVRFADELAALVQESHVQLEATSGARRLRVIARGQGLATWQLPNTFEPFYPQRLLRGQSHGLGLFLAQTVMLGHRGQATVRRRQDGGLQLDFLLPAQ